MSGSGLTARSTTGIWCVRSGDRVIGPFDGRSPATHYATRLQRYGFEAKAERMWSAKDGLIAAGLWSGHRW